MEESKKPVFLIIPSFVTLVQLLLLVLYSLHFLSTKYLCLMDAAALDWRRIQCTITAHCNPVAIYRQTTGKFMDLYHCISFVISDWFREAILRSDPFSWRSHIKPAHEACPLEENTRAMQSLVQEW